MLMIALTDRFDGRAVDSTSHRALSRQGRGLLVGVIVILYLLQYFPALSLGPVVEHFLMLDGKTF